MIEALEEGKIKCPGCNSERVVLLCLPQCTHEIGWPPIKVQYYICKDCKKIFYKHWGYPLPLTYA
ncbi:hypothetical protein KAS14_05790 [Candidatus Bathyarchaeota archaeon]|nr:hypothetical protein [Candidatus Bathyarchaeota archaeon]